MGGIHGIAMVTLTHVAALGNEGRVCAGARVRKAHEGLWKKVRAQAWENEFCYPQTPNWSDLNKDSRSLRSEANRGAWQMRSDVFEAPE